MREWQVGLSQKEVSRDLPRRRGWSQDLRASKEPGGRRAGKGPPGTGQGVCKGPAQGKSWVFRGRWKASIGAVWWPGWPHILVCWDHPRSHLLSQCICPKCPGLGNLFHGHPDDKEEGNDKKQVREEGGSQAHRLCKEFCLFYAHWEATGCCFCNLPHTHLTKAAGKFETRNFHPFINQNIFIEHIRHCAMHWRFKNEKEGLAWWSSG